MLARVLTAGVLGIDPIPLGGEVDNHPGTSYFSLVGLPDQAVKESRDRVGSALRNSGYRFPRGTVIVNLSPADVRKEGTALDLPIAVGMLVAGEQIAGEHLAEYAMAGELALDGSIRPVPGALSLAIGARNQSLRGIVLPEANVIEAGVVEGIKVIPVATLNEAADFIAGKRDIAPHVTDVKTIFEQARRHVPDLTDVKGQAHVKRALTVAAAGGHNLLMIGPPGTGKTMLASRLPGILPDMTFDEALETTRVFSVAQLTSAPTPLQLAAPYRQHHFHLRRRHRHPPTSRRSQPRT
ncbi:MAG: ATP-binding protein [Candidatus Hydrogenedentes bacterium]|nr:ATP-binding protein [Candidatus Hydrogenedentota bacterium]